MNIILFGPPGSGKGTQANKLANQFSLKNVSTGELLRIESIKNTDKGNKIKSIIDKGQLVSDEIIGDLIINILSDKKISNKIIFDGYPRNLNQAKLLENLMKKYKQKISCVLSLKVDKDIVTKRILGRQSCSKCGKIFNKFFNPANNTNHSCEDKFLNKRADDNIDTIVKRLETYFNETLPMLKFYEEQSLLHEIDGNGEINQIFKEICGIISSLEAWLYKSYLYK